MKNAQNDSVITWKNNSRVSDDLRDDSAAKEKGCRWEEKDQRGGGGGGDGCDSDGGSGNDEGDGGGSASGVGGFCGGDKREVGDKEGNPVF